MARITYILPLLLLCLFSGCSKDDDSLAEDPFYANVLTSVTAEELDGTWAIFQLKYQENFFEVPADYEDCGRNFFQFLKDGTYREYLLLNSYECETQVQDLQWELQKGIIDLSHPVGLTEEMVIVKLTPTELNFRIKVDVDEDGKLDIVTMIARPYSPPNDRDFYTQSFQPLALNNRIELTWLAYDGFYQFDRYEIFRSKNGCSKASAELLATIENPAQNRFVDEAPPVAEEVCYFFKIYNEKGLLGESQLVSFFTGELRPAEVGFSDAWVVNEAVELNWEPYQGRYFSHYEIRVRNYESGSGSGYFEEKIIRIDDKETTSFLHESPPYLADPVYAIYAFDIFGNVSSGETRKENTWTLDWQHPEVLPFDQLDKIVMDPSAPEFYFYGRKIGAYEYQLLKYNYATNQVSATANRPPGNSTGLPMQVHDTPNGKELFFPQGNVLEVFQASTLEYKYSLKTAEGIYFEAFAYLGDDLWALIDKDSIHTYKRENGNFQRIESQPHFVKRHSNGYHLLALEDGQVLVGNPAEAQSLKFSISTSGNFMTRDLVSMPFRSTAPNQYAYNASRDYIAVFSENRLYSTHSFTVQESFEKPFYPTGISRNGDLILGSNNPPEYPTNTSLQQKKAVIYDLVTGQVTTLETEGYPHKLFENHLGQIISISSGFRRKGLETSSPKADLFIEVFAEME